LKIQELIAQRLPRSVDDAVMPSSSTSEFEYKWKYEEAERTVSSQREKISILRKETQEEVNSIKRQQTQMQQEMEAKQKQMEEQIEFLLSQHQLRRDPPT
jgi:gas vesicle protein